MGDIYYYNSDQYDNGMEPTDTVYSDRLFQWDHEKYNKTRHRLFGNEGQGWFGIPPEDVEKFLQEYMCDDSIRICRIERSENRATGNPLWRFDFRRDTEIRAPFTQEQVDQINRSQSGGMHPFTCCSPEEIQGCTRASGETQGILSCGTEGLVCPCGEYRQEWVHRRMTETPAIKSEPILDNETVVGYEGTCEACGGAIDKYDKFTEEMHCTNCGWTGGIL